MRSTLLKLLIVVALTTTAFAAPVAAQSAPTTVAFDLVDSDSENLAAYTNEVTDNGGYSSTGDGFGIFQRGVSDSIPFSVLDDSGAGFASDDLGIIGANQTEAFFGATDTVNNDAFDDAVTATWTFDVSGADGPLFLNVDAGAMGDFESSDSFVFAAAFGDAEPTPVLSSSVDEDATRSYTLDDGDTFTLDDPLALDGVALDDDLTTVSTALDGSGSTLTVTFTAETNGGSEAFAFDSLVITSGAPLAEDGGDGGDNGDGDNGEEAPTCDATDITLISAVQGDGFTSPLAGEDVTVEGAVTAIYPELGGIAVQEEPGDADGDPATSEGVFVFLGFDADTSDLAAGDVVQVSGSVSERFGNTQISGDVVECDADQVTIAPTEFDLPADDAARESLEGMLVTTTEDLTVTGLFTAYEFGELGVSASGILDNPTSVYEPGSEQALALEEANAQNLLYIDDRDEFGFDNDPWFGEAGERAGDIVEAGVTGVLYYSFGDYLLEPVGEFPEIIDSDAAPADREDAPELDAGNDVASFNVLNYFNTFGDSAELRGAQSEEQFETQTAKIVDAIIRLDAAVLGLIEIENDYEDETPAIQTLVEALNAADSDQTYDWVRVDDLLTDEGFGGLGTDAIANGIIYQPDRATPTGDAATFDIDALLRGEDTDNNRWPLAQTFDIDGEEVTVVVNHFKSKGSACTDTVVPDGYGDGENDPQTGSCDLVREYAAERLLEWIETKPTGVNTPDTLVIGDLNSYEEEDPIEIFIDAGYRDLVERYDDDAFTYKFDGRFGRLDYILASPSAKRLVEDAEVWQINSAEPYGYLYYLEPIDDTAFASSDHDPVVASLDAPGRGQGRGEGRGQGRGGRR